MMYFTNREEYILAAIDWKQRYAKLTLEIQAIKFEFRKAQRAYAANPSENYSALLRKQREKDHTARKATEMIAERHASKVEAQKQYLESRSK